MPRRGRHLHGWHGRRIHRRQPQSGSDRQRRSHRRRHRAAPLTHPWSATLTGASWARLAGHGGYVFPGRATLRALREERTGRWSDINKGGSGAAISRRYLTTVLISERSDGTAVICVSDPMRMQTSLSLSWQRAVASVISRPATVTGATTGSSLMLTFGDLSGTGGATQKITVGLG
ncbi:polysaccharide lyase family 8 super-sandwich domain-containing protein [Streptomyces sp. NPDC050485]|uniref:polysaccharide lyase family 8 super-sandwich domain-containing protein n=1 Tax=Streptomyces sp. NPDC050485 TaxID=3365617 RepID=UPI0037B879AF